MQQNKEYIEKELRAIKEYIEKETTGKVEYELKNNDDNEEYIEIIVNFENNKKLIFRFDEVEISHRRIPKKCNQVGEKEDEF